MLWPVILVLALAAPFLLFSVAFICWVNSGGLYLAFRQWRQKRVAQRLVCAVNADCPEGYVCVNGKCVLAT